MKTKGEVIINKPTAPPLKEKTRIDFNRENFTANIIENEFIDDGKKFQLRFVERAKLVNYTAIHIVDLNGN